IRPESPTDDVGQPPAARAPTVSIGGSRPAPPAAAAAANDSKRIGERVGGYVLERLLGRGGMGAGHGGPDGAGVRRAVKLPRFEGADASGRRARFTREALALAGLRPHPNIVRVHASGEDEGRAYCVLELVEGETLDWALRHGPLPLARALEIAEQIARAL